MKGHEEIEYSWEGEESPLFLYKYILMAPRMGVGDFSTRFLLALR